MLPARVRISAEIHDLLVEREASWSAAVLCRFCGDNPRKRGFTASDSISFRGKAANQLLKFQAVGDVVL
jgi:hypothetical protein